MLETRIFLIGVMVLIILLYFTKTTYSYKTMVEMDLLNEECEMEEKRASKKDQQDGHYLLIKASPKILKKLQSKYGGFIVDDVWRSEIY